MLRATLESTDDAVLVVDTAGRVVQFNRRFAETWELARRSEEDIAEGPFDLDKVRDPDLFARKLADLARHPEEIRFDMVEFTDGRIFESYSQPQRMDQRVVGRVWSFRDVTVRVNAQRERDRLLVDERRARAGAEAAVRIRDEFLSVASHELRTPLTSLQLAIDGLSRRLGAEAAGPIARNLTLARRQLRRLGNLVGLLLDASRIQAGRLELDRHVIDLRAVVRDSAAQLTEDVSRSGSELTVRGDRPVIGFWDASRMEQLSINLMTNALKFGGEKPIAITVDECRGHGAPRGGRRRHRHVARGAGAHLRTLRTGRLGPALRGPRAGPLHRPHDRRGARRTCLCHERAGARVDLHGGAPHLAVAARAGPGGGAVTGTGCTVCVVDDDDDIREVLADVLSEEGFDVVAAGDGESALGLLHSRAPACRLILLDLMMPRMNGWEFRRKQLEDPAIAEIPVLLLTGAGNGAKAIDELHVAGTIEKPVELDVLLAKVAQYCG